jgi:hypothetical protein
VVTAGEDPRLEVARRAARSLGRQPGVLGSYVSGSLVAGLGTPTSDADVFVVLAEGVDRPGTRQLLVGADRVDVEFTTAAEIGSAVRRCTSYRPTRTDLSAARAPQDTVDLVVRLLLGEIVADEGWLGRTQKEVRSAEQEVRRLLVGMWSLYVHGSLEDFTGAVADGDVLSAGLLGQWMMTAAGKATAAAAGDLYVGDKWVHRQVARSAGPSFPVEEFSGFQLGWWTREPVDPGAADRLVLFAQTMLAVAQLTGWDAPAPDWADWRPGTGRLRRNPGFLSMRVTEGFLLHQERVREAVLSPVTALVWTLCLDRDDDEVVRGAVRLSGRLPGMDPLTEDRARAVLGRLIDKQFVLCR